MKSVTCPPPCGHVMQNEDEEALLDDVVAHAREVHPEMAEGKTDEELKAQARPLIKDEE